MTNKINFTPTTEKIISQNYPYGFREKTTKTDYLRAKRKALQIAKKYKDTHLYLHLKANL